jgi:hypothetical protein
LSYEPHHHQHRPRVGRPQRPRVPPQPSPLGAIVPVTVTPRRPAAPAPHVYMLATVRELPPAARPGTFDSTW